MFFFFYFLPLRFKKTHAWFTAEPFKPFPKAKAGQIGAIYNWTAVLNHVYSPFEILGQFILFSLFLIVTIIIIDYYHLSLFRESIESILKGTNITLNLEHVRILYFLICCFTHFYRILILNLKYKTIDDSNCLTF